MEAYKEIIITRKNSPWGCAVAFTVLLDGKEVGILRNGETISAYAQDGPHTLSFQKGKKIDCSISILISPEDIARVVNTGISGSHLAVYIEYATNTPKADPFDYTETSQIQNRQVKSNSLKARMSNDIIAELKISKFTFVLPILFMFILLIMGKTEMFSMLDNKLATTLIVILAIFVELIYVVIYFGTKVVLYEDRIKIKKIWPQVTHVDIPLNKINGIVASGRDAFGNLTINTSSGNYDFHYASNPMSFRDAAINEIEERDFRRMKRQARAIRSEFDD